MIVPVRGFTPQIQQGTFVAETANIIGDVRIGANCSIWYQTTLRGDVMPIEIGDESNIQDNTVIHGTFQKCGAKIGRKVTVGHSVILHGCTIGDLVLVGMGAIVMDQAYIANRCIVGAGALVTENARFEEEGMLILGRPAKVVRKLTAKELDFLPQSAANYVLYKSWYQEGKT